MEVPGNQNSPRRTGMKRQRDQVTVYSDRDDDGDRRMSIDSNDATMCSNGASGDDDETEQPLRKRAMIIKANLRFLEKLPPLRDYQRSRNGRRGAIDGGTLTGAMMLSALEESFEETSFVTLEPPTREAMVAPAPVPTLPTPSPVQPSSREISPTHNTRWVRSSATSAGAVQPTLSSAKDDESRPASK